RELSQPKLVVAAPAKTMRLRRPRAGLQPGCRQLRRQIGAGDVSDEAAMKLLIYPAIDADRLEHVCDAAGGMRVVNASSLDEALTEIADADGFFGRLTPELLAAS